MSTPSAAGIPEVDSTVGRFSMYITRERRTTSSPTEVARAKREAFRPHLAHLLGEAAQPHQRLGVRHEHLGTDSRTFARTLSVTSDVLDTAE
jgi:hypothetical protein